MGYVVLHSSAARRARPALIYVFSTQPFCPEIVYFMYYFGF